ncbi:MAG: choice-of-anchor D domain-containing protein [Flavobacteriaceae bacterium]
METTTLHRKKFISLFISLFLLTIGYAQTSQTFNSSGNFVVPAGVTTVTVQLWGAGGGGSSAANASGGGGGGAYTTAVLSVTPNTTIPVTVGIGGGVGNAGTSSSIMSVSANGGAAGGNRAGGAGGAASAIIAPVTASFAGGNGGNGRTNSGGSNNEAGGGGGASATTSAAGGAGSNGGSSTTTATAGGIGTGNGGVGAAADGNPVATIGNAPGGGGGGRAEGASSAMAGANGRVTISWICPTYSLTNATTATGPFCGSSASTVTIKSSTMPSGTYNVTYDLSGATTASGSTAIVTFTSGAPGTGTFTTPALNPGVTTVTITAINSAGACSVTPASNNTVNITVNTTPTANAGTAVNTCSTSGAVNITGGSSATNYSSVQWTSSGTGTFTNATDLTTCTYTPSAADIIAGSATITLTAYGNTPCSNATSSKTLNIRAAATSNAGTAINTCYNSGAVNITLGSSATNYSSILWTSSGTGTFANAASLTTCTYNPSAADIAAGTVTLTLTANGNTPCSNVSANKTLTIQPGPTANAGTNVSTCNTGAAVNITAGSAATNYSSVQWTASGLGTLTNANSLTTCTYTPTVLDILAGSVTLTLTATGNAPCGGTAVSNKTLYIYAPSTAIAGTNVTICATTATTNISAGSSATNYTSVLWTSSGTGTFTNANNLSTCTYTPSAADKAAGSVTITLTASNPGCANAISNKTLFITAAPTAVAGTTVNTCSTTGAVNITAGASATNHASVLWTSSGSGTFANATSLTLCTYTPSAADISAGSVTLTLTAIANSPCSNVTSTKTLNISRAMTAVAGSNFSMCSSSGSVSVVTGATATFQTAILWSSSGTGTFSNPTNINTCSYTPSAADIAAGSVVITLTATNAGCSPVSSTKTLTIYRTPVVSAGPAMSTCSTTGAVNITSGSSASYQASVLWTSSGTGTFANANSLTTCTYTPSAADITAGSVTLTLTAFGNAPCGNSSSTKTLTINTAVSVTGTTPGSRTGTGTVLLGATASGGTLNWYSSATGGSSLGTGTSFTTPVISTTTTFYVEAVNGACASTPRTAVVATVNYPEIDIQGNATTIVDGDITPSTTDWTDFGSATATRTFTIRNTGSALLTIGAITISGANASEFTVTTAPSATVAIGSSTTFTVTFAPTAVGVRSANISIANNDNDENPYDFNIQGTGVEQEMDIQGNGVTISDGDNSPSTSDWTDFSNVAGTRTYTIRNLGNIELTVGTVMIGGANAADFTVTTPPAATVPAFGSTTFVVAFSPSAINTRVATISIDNNDANENPYNYSIQGFGIIPEIDIQGNAVTIVDGDATPSTTDWTDFGSSANTRTFTIYNNGNIALTLGAYTIGGTNASEFTVTTPPAATVAAFSSTTFTITFAPTAVGVRTATFSIVNNDSNENPYNFSIQGTGTTREIDVQGLGLSIADGDTVTSVSDGTDFGPVDINLATITRTFTIRNTGSIPLTISNPTITGANAADFTITTNPGTLTIGAGSSTTFQVTFNPSAVFTRVAQINIVNNDSDENPYNFAIQGTGLLDNDGDGIENNTDQDDDNDGILDNIECGICVSDPFVNGSFETPVIGTSTYSIQPSANVTGWNNSAENFIEIWSTGFNGVPSAAGNQFAELNANVAGNLYQTFCLNAAGGTIYWSIKHRGRSGTDTAAVRFGPSLSSLTTVQTMTDGNTAWGSYSGTYTIPVGQTSIVLAFTAISSTGGLSYGNFIDDVQIIINQNCVDTDGDAVADILDVDSDNDGIPDIEEAGFKAYSNKTGTMDKTSAANWVDANANGINDYIDSRISAGTYVIPDTDGDGIYNHLDLDSDNDSLFDVDESGLLNGDGDINGDGKGDGADTEGDGMLNLYDNSTNFGVVGRAYAQDSDSNGIPDYMQLDSNDDGTNDIQTGLYASFDTNGDGKIDGTGDTDRDGILDVFDTDDVQRGSPRDLNRKLYLDFDGRNDYAENVALIGGLSNATLMAWIDLNSAFSATGTVVGQDKFHIKVSSSRTLQAVVNGTTLTFGTPLNKSQWYHVAATYGGGTLSLYLNGKLVASQALTGNIAADASKLTLGKDPLTSTNYFKGKIDEVRVFNTTLTALQVQRMVYQEIQNSSSQVRGMIVPKDVGSLPFANVLRYYRMDAYKDDIVDDLTTAAIDTGTGMKMYNHKVIAVQEAPMPFTTIRTGTFATAINDSTKDIRGLDVLDYDYAIIQARHNITETANNTHMGLFVNPGVTVTMNNDTKIQNDWYLKLDGKIDLQGKSQLVQTINSDLDVTSAGSAERDQQGQSNKYNYNYWCSPVGAINATSNNNAYTVAGVMKDGTNPNNIQNINWTTAYDGAATSPVTLSSYWIFKFQNLTPQYANWSAVGQNGSLSAAQGFTLKGTGAATATQNYTFVGKPNNGTITTAIAAGNLNLCGNPYPSALDADAFLTANSTVTTGSIYFWEHYSTNSSHMLLDYQGGYAARNLVGGTPPVAPTGISGQGSSSRIPSRYIPVGQGFLVYGSSTGGTITFDNSQRAFIKEDNASSNIMFRQDSGSASADRTHDNREDMPSGNTDTFARIRLGFDSANNYHRQILMGFMDNLATDGYDVGYDTEQIDTQPNDLYFKMGAANLVIQGVGSFNANKIYPLSLKNSVEGNIKFVLDDVENLDATQNIFIHDNVTNLYHNIRNQDFQINLPVGTYTDRFSLRFSTSPNLGVDDFNEGDEVSVAYTSADNMINISKGMSNTTIKGVELINMLGQNIKTWNVDHTTGNKIQIPVTNISTGTYIVKVLTSKGDLTKKIIIK